jgi:hypothetical protein
MKLLDFDLKPRGQKWKESAVNEHSEVHAKSVPLR